MSDKITNLEIELDKADNDIKELEELLRNKKRIANLLEDELRKVNKEKDRSILFLKVDLENAITTIEEKDVIINRLKNWKAPRRNSKDSKEQIQEQPIFIISQKKKVEDDEPEKKCKKTIALQTSLDENEIKIRTLQESVQTTPIDLEPQIIIKEVEAKL